MTRADSDPTVGAKGDSRGDEVGLSVETEEAHGRQPGKACRHEKLTVPCVAVVSNPAQEKLSDPVSSLN